MAWTYTEVGKSVFGNKRTVIYSVTTDSTAQEHQPGLSIVESVHVTPTSMATGGYNVKLNVLSAATASPGTVAYKSMATGDTFSVLYVGR